MDEHRFRGSAAASEAFSTGYRGDGFDLVYVVNVMLAHAARPLPRYHPRRPLSTGLSIAMWWKGTVRTGTFHHIVAVLEANGIAHSVERLPPSFDVGHVAKVMLAAA